MNQSLTVVPGVNLARHLAQFSPAQSGVTKRWVREAMRQHPEWDWRIHGETSYVNAESAIRYDLDFQVVDPASPGTVRAVVAFHTVDGETVAVVR